MEINWIWCSYGQLGILSLVAIWHLAFSLRQLPATLRYVTQFVSWFLKDFCKKEGLVRRTVEDLQANIAEDSLKILSHVMFGVLAVEVWQNRTDCQRRTAILFVLVPPMFLARIRRLATPKLIHAIHFYWIVLLCLYRVWFPGHSALRFATEDLLRITAVVTSCNLWVSTVANLVYCVAIVTMLYTSGDVPWRVSLYVQTRITTTAFLILFAGVLDWVLRRLARLMLDSKVSAQNEAVVVRLLNGMCDAVVRLRFDYTIERHSPQLAALLIHAPSASGLEGVPFQDLLHEDDRTIFCERLADSTKASTASESSGTATHANVSCSMPGNMRDSLGNRVRVQLFHTSVQDVNEELFHVVGIREDSVEEQLAPMPLFNRSTFSRSVNSTVASSITATHESEAAEAASDAGSAAVSLQPEVASEASSVLSEALDLTCDAVVWVDVRTPKMTVTRSSSGFHSLCGPSNHSTELLPLVAREQRQRFKEWVKSAVEAQMRGQSPAAQFEGLILQPRHLKRHRISARGNAVLSREMDAPNGGTLTENIWQLALSNIEWIHGRASTAAAPPMVTSQQRNLFSTAAGGSTEATEI